MNFEVPQHFWRTIEIPQSHWSTFKYMSTSWIFKNGGMATGAMPLVSEWKKLNMAKQVIIKIQRKCFAIERAYNPFIMKVYTVSVLESHSCSMVCPSRSIFAQITIFSSWMSPNYHIHFGYVRTPLKISTMTFWLVEISFLISKITFWLVIIGIVDISNIIVTSTNIIFNLYCKNNCRYLQWTLPLVRIEDKQLTFPLVRIQL